MFPPDAGVQVQVFCLVIAAVIALLLAVVFRSRFEGTSGDEAKTNQDQEHFSGWATEYDFASGYARLSASQQNIYQNSIPNSFFSKCNDIKFSTDDDFSVSQMFGSYLNCVPTTIRCPADRPIVSAIKFHRGRDGYTIAGMTVSSVSWRGDAATTHLSMSQCKKAGSVAGSLIVGAASAQSSVLELPTTASEVARGFRIGFPSLGKPATPPAVLAKDFPYELIKSRQTCKVQGKVTERKDVVLGNLPSGCIEAKLLVEIRKDEGELDVLWRKFSSTTSSPSNGTRSSPNSNSTPSSSNNSARSSPSNGTYSNGNNCVCVPLLFFAPLVYDMDLDKRRLEEGMPCNTAFTAVEIPHLCLGVRIWSDGNTIRGFQLLYAN